VFSSLYASLSCFQFFTLWALLHFYQHKCRKSVGRTCYPNFSFFKITAASCKNAPPLDLLSSLKKEKTIVVYNKADLLESQAYQLPGILVSAKNLKGIERLKEEIKNRLFSSKHLTNDQIILTKERHHQALLYRGLVS
jgi:tRNA U34 5-carboxymethylaminomethyl modifying GTPase MnmE/TrmE